MPLRYGLDPDGGVAYSIFQIDMGFDQLLHAEVLGQGHRQATRPH